MKAPYAPGDKIRTIYEDDSGETEGELLIDRVVDLGRGWRLECDRPNSILFPRVHVIVDAAGNQVDQ